MVQRLRAGQLSGSLAGWNHTTVTLLPQKWHHISCHRERLRVRFLRHCLKMYFFFKVPDIWELHFSKLQNLCLLRSTATGKYIFKEWFARCLGLCSYIQRKVMKYWASLAPKCNWDTIMICMTKTCTHTNMSQEQWTISIEGKDLQKYLQKWILPWGHS